MMIDWVYLGRPLIGAVIGYITNDIAIRMLFRPHKPKYVLGHRIPFTPGIIPKEKNRIAASIGKAISDNLMNRDVLQRTLLSEEMIEKIVSAYDSFIASLKSDTRTLEQYLSTFLKTDDINYIRNQAAADLSDQIHTVISSSNLGAKIASIAVDHVIQKVRSGLLGIFGADKALALVAPVVESLLAKNIDEMLRDNSQPMVKSLIVKGADDIMNSRMCDLVAGREVMIDKCRETIVSLYTSMVTDRLPGILDALNISSIIESRINEMDMAETEKLIFEVMHKELKAIVWLGALLGFLMGCINLLF